MVLEPSMFGLVVRFSADWASQAVLKDSFSTWLINIHDRPISLQKPEACSNEWNTSTSQYILCIYCIVLHVTKYLHLTNGEKTQMFCVCIQHAKPDQALYLIWYISNFYISIPNVVFLHNALKNSFVATYEINFTLCVLLVYDDHGSVQILCIMGLFMVYAPGMQLHEIF